LRILLKPATDYAGNQPAEMSKANWVVPVLTGFPDWIKERTFKVAFSIQSP
jgi:hypothetical protein